MKYSLDKKIYIINIVVLSFFTLTILFLLCENLISQKKDIIKGAKNQTEATAKFILADVDKLIHGIEELSEGIHSMEEHHEEKTSNHNTYIDRLLNNDKRPYIKDIIILNKNLEIVHDTNYHHNTHKHTKSHKSATKESLVDHYFNNSEFKAFYKNKLKENSLFVGSPFKSELDNKWSFIISKAFIKNSTIEHIVLVIVDLEFITMKYTSYLDKPDSSFFFANKNGDIYTRVPFKKKYLGAKIKEIEDFTKEHKKIKHFEIASPLDNKFRIATLIKSTHYPIIAGSSMLTENILEPWEKQKENTVLISVLLFIGLSVIIIYYRKLQNKLINLSQIDGLTQLFNRNYFTKQAEQAFKRAKRYEENIVVIMLDIDNFKKINDNYGHQTGDKVIQKLSRCIQAGIRDVDIAGRYGGEEFIILLENIDIDNAKIVASRIKDSFEEGSIEGSYDTTASFGISNIKKDDVNLEVLIHRADEALYVSKNSGKNCITVR